MSEYREFRDAADVFAACCPKAKHFDGDCAAANRLYPILEKIRERAIATADDPRDATIRELRALCGEAAVQLDEYLDYERAEHICIVIGDVALAAKLRAASAAQALEETAQRIRKEIKG